MDSPAAVREFFKTVLQQVYHFKVDIIAGDGTLHHTKYFKSQEHPRSARLLLQSC